MHAGAFEAGFIAVLNVITMSVFVSLLLIHTESLLAPIIAHFIWNSIGRLVFGVVSMADDYPSMWNCNISGNILISGGEYKIEGSIVVLAANLILIALMTFLLKRRAK
jgi:membrane protease YdiL (CAAX protease family)